MHILKKIKRILLAVKSKNKKIGKMKFWKFYLEELKNTKLVKKQFYFFFGNCKQTVP